MGKWGMNNRVKQLIVRSFLLVFLILPFGASAFSYDGILAFGDSLSDNGYLADVPGGTPGNYGFGYYTNNHVWVEYLANPFHFDVPLFDMAYGGATTGYGNPAAGYPTMFGLNWQVDVYNTALHPSPISSDTLVTVWAGANDMFQQFNSGIYNTSGSSGAAANIALAIQKLANKDAMNFLVPNLPDIGMAPAFRGGLLQAAATGWCTAFNSYLAADLAALLGPNPGVHIYTFDTFTLLDAVIANPAAYDFDNVTGQWKLKAPEDMDRYLFWDGVHPMDQAHSMLADAMFRGMQVPVPIPAAFLLFGSGLIGLFGIRRKLS